jgi:hypothetical protein
MCRGQLRDAFFFRQRGGNIFTPFVLSQTRCFLRMNVSAVLMISTCLVHEAPLQAGFDAFEADVLEHAVECVRSSL